MHIADVSHFVQPKTALDREARERGTSVYLPDRVIPMLPEIISNGLASLQPGKVRYTKSAFMEFSPEGAALAQPSSSTRPSPAASGSPTSRSMSSWPIASAWRRKLGAKVHEAAGPDARIGDDPPQAAAATGPWNSRMREVKVDLDPHGRVAGAHVVENTESHQIIEDFMLAANEAVAAMLHDRELPFLRRVHQSPDDAKLAALTEFINELGFQVGSLEAVSRCKNYWTKWPASRSNRRSITPCLRSLQRAVYSPEEEGHYALASDTYCHFTSPIRRYPDLIIHRQLTTILAGHKPPQRLRRVGRPRPALFRTGAAGRSGRTRADQDKLLAYMSDRIGEEIDGVITGVESFGLFVQGSNCRPRDCAHRHLVRRLLPVRS